MLAGMNRENSINPGSQLVEGEAPEAGEVA